MCGGEGGIFLVGLVGMKGLHGGRGEERRRRWLLRKGREGSVVDAVDDDMVVGSSSGGRGKGCKVVHDEKGRGDRGRRRSLLPLPQLRLSGNTFQA